MSNLKRTRANFPKMKVRGARRKWEMKLESIAKARIERFNLAMRLLGIAAEEAGVRFRVLGETLEQLREANRIDKPHV